MICAQFETQLTETKSHHEQLVQSLNEEQQRIKQEMEKLEANHQEEKNQLKSEYEALVQEAKEKEKVYKSVVFASLYFTNDIY